MVSWERDVILKLSMYLYFLVNDWVYNYAFQG